MRKLILGLAAAVTLGLTALAPQAASAQGFSVTIGSGYMPVAGPYGYYPPPPRRGYYPPPRHGYYGRPYPPRAYYGRPYRGPRCVVRVNRYWDGYGWVSQRRRVCR